MKKFLFAVIAMLILSVVPLFAQQSYNINLAWDANPPADQVSNYLVFEGPSTNGPWVQVASVQTNAATVQKTTPGTYFYHVKAQNLWSMSGPSNIVNTPGPPHDPTGLIIRVDVTVTVKPPGN